MRGLRKVKGECDMEVVPPNRTLKERVRVPKWQHWSATRAAKHKAT